MYSQHHQELFSDRHPNILERPCPCPWSKVMREGLTPRLSLNFIDRRDRLQLQSLSWFAECEFTDYKAAKEKCKNREALENFENPSGVIETKLVGRKASTIYSQSSYQTTRKPVTPPCRSDSREKDKYECHCYQALTDVPKEAFQKTRIKLVVVGCVELHRVKHLSLNPIKVREQYPFLRRTGSWCWLQK